MEQIGQKIKQLRIENNLSQEQFADVIGISRSNVSKWESNLITPSVEMISLIAKKFNLEISYFFSYA